jgi:hypothetical protein
MGDEKPIFAFISPPSQTTDEWYPYHVMVAGQFVFKSRDAVKARAVATCCRGQLWRTPMHPAYPPFVLCDFAVEEWSTVSQ